VTPAVHLRFVVIYVSHELRHRIAVRETEEQRQRDGRARVGAREIPEEGSNHRVGVRGVAPEVNERIDARRPTTQAARVTDEGSHPRRIADSEALEAPVEREDGEARFARARARI